MADVKVLYHSSIRISGEKTVYFDPFKISGEPLDGDVVFVTHDHFDHFSEEDIKKTLKKDGLLVVPRALKKKAEKLSDRVITVEPDEKYDADGIITETVCSYNVGKPFHKKADNWVGYIVTLEGCRYYVAGDTDENPDNINVKCDVALVPIGGKFTMDAEAAAAFVNRMRPKKAIPTHYGSVAGSPEDGERFKELVDKDIETELSLEF